MDDDARYRWLDRVLAAPLSKRAKVVAAYLFNRAGEDLWCWPTQARIAEGCGMTMRTVQLAIDELVPAWVIRERMGSVSGPGRGKANRYRLVIYAQGLAPGQCDKAQKRVGIGARSCASQAQGFAHRTTHEQTNNNPADTRKPLRLSDDDDLQAAAAECGVYAVDELAACGVTAQTLRELNAQGLRDGTLVRQAISRAKEMAEVAIRDEARRKAAEELLQEKAAEDEAANVDGRRNTIAMQIIGEHGGPESKVVKDAHAGNIGVGGRVYPLFACRQAIAETLEPGEIDRRLALVGA